MIELIHKYTYENSSSQSPIYDIRLYVAKLFKAKNTLLQQQQRFKAFPFLLFFTDAYFPHMCVYATATAFRISNLEIRVADCGDKNKSKSKSQQQQEQKQWLTSLAGCATERNNTGSSLTHATVDCEHPHTRQFTVPLNGAGNWTIAHLQPGSDV